MPPENSPYCEKPVIHKLNDGKALIKAQRKLERSSFSGRQLRNGSVDEPGQPAYGAAGVIGPYYFVMASSPVHPAG